MTAAFGPAGGMPEVSPHLRVLCAQVADERVNNALAPWSSPDGANDYAAAAAGESSGARLLMRMLAPDGCPWCAALLPCPLLFPTSRRQPGSTAVPSLPFLRNAAAAVFSRAFGTSYLAARALSCRDFLLLSSP